MTQAYIIGLGKSGIASAKLLQQNGWDVILCDRSTNPKLEISQQELEKSGITVKLGYTPSLNSESLPNLIVVSPGVPWDVPLLIEARKLNIETIGELELAWRYLNKTPWIGITGTNGKTTTTALIGAIFKAAGLNAPTCGNIGQPATELALESAKLDWIIAEISSYQIESSQELAPKIAIWTTFTPDHLNRHKNLENYHQIKATLLHRSHQQIINGDDPYLRSHDVDLWKNSYWTSVKGKANLPCHPSRGVYLEDAWVTAFGELILPISLFKMVGRHNQQNLLMAVAAAKLAGIDKGAIASAISSFTGVPHRLEYVCTYRGVDFINDSKATNYDAAEVGLKAVNGPVILIAGGEAKEGDDTAWIAKIKDKAAAVLLIGDAGNTFGKRLQECGYEAYEIVETMDKAVKRAAQMCEQLPVKVVLLSPACASFDQYQSFEHRGEHFKELCLNL
jgi:UDP-N-acetylmuramoylalanine--D-glutamate ligase